MFPTLRPAAESSGPPTDTLDVRSNLRRAEDCMKNALSQQWIEEKARLRSLSAKWHHIQNVDVFYRCEMLHQALRKTRIWLVRTSKMAEHAVPGSMVGIPVKLSEMLLE
jgi:hypothetical protein